MVGVRDADSALRSAESLFAEGKFVDSEAAFGSLLGTEKRADALLGLGLISFQTGNLSRAQALFEQSLGVERPRPNTLYYLGRTLLDRGASVNKAVAYLEEALRYDPRHEPARRLLVSIGRSAPYATTSEATPSEKAGGTGPAGPPRRPQNPSALVGVVTQLTKRTTAWRGKPAAAQEWAFRLDVRDLARGGASIGIVGVQLQGHDIEGTLENGDWVEIGDRPKPGKGLQPKELRNLTGGDVVRARWRWFMAK